jgi:short-subunit dehydrogenase
MGQVDVNIRALVKLTHAFVQGMVARRKGGIINLASSAGFQPLAGANIYAASKSFVILFSEALAQEIYEAQEVQ